MIDEHYIDKVNNGLNATFERQNSSFDLEVSKIYPEVRNGKFRVDLVFTGEKPENIRTGQTYYINLQLGEPSKCIIIPRGSFYQSTGGKWIYVVNEDGTMAEKRLTKIGQQNLRH